MTRAALPVLRTPRLTLRPQEMTDADAIVAGIGNYDVSRWLGRVPYPYSHADAVEWLEKNVGTDRPIWAITRDDALIGVVGVGEELGYWLTRPAWGRGYGFEAAQAAVAQWFFDPANGDLPSGYYEENHRSARVLAAIGFREMSRSPRYSLSLQQEVPGVDMLLTRAAWEERQKFEVTTDRLTIRPLTENDASDMRALAVPEVARNTGSFDPDWTEATVATYIGARRWRGLPGGMFAVEEDRAFIGIVGIGSIEGAPLSAMYAFKPEVWGRGIATRTMQAFLAEVFARYPVNRIIADHHEDNPASGAVLRKLGFAEIGRGMGASKARLEPAPTITYAVTRDTFEAST